MELNEEAGVCTEYACTYVKSMANGGTRHRNLPKGNLERLSWDVLNRLTRCTAQTLAVQSIQARTVCGFETFWAPVVQRFRFLRDVMLWQNVTLRCCKYVECTVSMRRPLTDFGGATGIKTIFLLRFLTSHLTSTSAIFAVKI